VDIDGLIEDMSVSSNVKAVISSIKAQLFQINLDNASSYLLDVETTIINSQSLNTTEKNQILAFIGVGNSSLHFWLVNG
jgi:hypothetical protein